MMREDKGENKKRKKRRGKDESEKREVLAEALLGRTVEAYENRSRHVRWMHSASERKEAAHQMQIDDDSVLRRMCNSTRRSFTERRL